VVALQTKLDSLQKDILSKIETINELRASNSSLLLELDKERSKASSNDIASTGIQSTGIAQLFILCILLFDLKYVKAICSRKWNLSKMKSRFSKRPIRDGKHVQPRFCLVQM
jgi:hypothetical protein